MCECLPLQRSGRYRTWPMPRLHPSQKCQGAHPGGGRTQAAIQSLNSTGWTLNSSFPWLSPRCNPWFAVMCSLPRAGHSVALFVFKFLLPFVFLWLSSSTTVWLSQNSALAQMHVQASVNKLPTMLFPSLNQVHLLADCTCYTPVLMKD